jgi:hypothetical protein
MLITEIGTDVSPFLNALAFASRLGLSPINGSGAAWSSSWSPRRMSMGSLNFEACPTRVSIGIGGKSSPDTASRVSCLGYGF